MKFFPEYIFWFRRVEGEGWHEHRPRPIFRSSPAEVFLGKIILKIHSNFTGEQTCWSVISIRLLSNAIEITLWHGRSLFHLLHIFRTPFYENTCGRLLLYFAKNTKYPANICWSWRRLQDVLKTCLEDVLKTCLEDLLKTLWRRAKYLLGTGDICI